MRLPQAMKKKKVISFTKGFGMSRNKNESKSNRRGNNSRKKKESNNKKENNNRRKS